MSKPGCVHILTEIASDPARAKMKSDLAATYKQAKKTGWATLDESLSLLMAGDLIYQTADTPGDDFCYLLDGRVAIALGLIEAASRCSTPEGLVDA